MDATELRGLLEEQLRLSRRLRERIRELEENRGVPLAIVGMAMRFPGGTTTPEEYWDFLAGTGSVECAIPADRPGLASVYDTEVGKPGHSYVGRAGFLSDLAEFDADFFGISQREAESLDPQQRLLLETAWEALERAGIAAPRAHRLDAGVFVGIMSAEYGDRLAAGAMDDVDPYHGTGGGHCFAAGRISHALGLRGPAVSLDTACSSSLVALHNAARSLRSGECRYALAAGANLLFSPHLMVSLCQSRALAPDGRSKPFTAAADGYGRGEGVATLALMRLDDAIREERPLLAVLRGTAVNHDGAASGLTVPSGPAQQEVISDALRDAGVSPEELSYVEAHGTGTALGDPIEAAALDAVFGAGHRRAATRLLVGSVKGRLGHLEAASGMAGLIKLVLMLEHEEIPVDVPESAGPLSDLIPWRDYRLEVPRRPRAWTGEGRLAGISAFGLSGTNAHVVLQAPPPTPAPPTPGTPAPAPVAPELLVLSARTETALHALAAAVSTRLLRTAPSELASVCHSLRAGRVAQARRLAVTGTTAEELARKVSLGIDAAASAVPRPPRSVTLAFAAARHDDLTKGAATIAADLPLLTAGEDGPEPDPGGWLTRALDALGLIVRVREDAGGACPAALEYAGTVLELVPAEPDRATGVFLDAVAELYRAGADLRLAPLRAPGARFLADLPTYPFQRRRFWIDEPGPRGSDPAAPAARAAAPAPGPEDAGDAVHPAMPVQPTMPVDPAMPVDAVERFLHTELAATLRAEDGLDPDLTFAELGGDSFTAMLFVKSVEERFQAAGLTEEFSADRPVAELIAELATAIGGPGR